MFAFTEHASDKIILDTDKQCSIAPETSLRLATHTHTRAGHLYEYQRVVFLYTYLINVKAIEIYSFKLRCV